VVTAFGKDRKEAIREVERFPQVADFSLLNIAGANVRAASGRTLKFPDVLPFASRDGRFGTTLNALKILSGRPADPERLDEAVASFTVAEKLNLEPGDRIQLGYFGTTAFGQRAPPGVELPPTLTLTVVGIGAAPGEFEPLAGGYLPGLHLTPAFYRAYPKYFNPEDEGVAIRLRHGSAELEAFKRELNAAKQRLDVNFDQPFNQAQQTAGVQQATRAQSVALWVLAVLVAVAGLAIFAQALARQTFLESTEYPTLRSLGLSPRQLLAVGVIRALAIGFGGAVIAAGVGMFLSPLTPTGLARIAEPDPGFAVDAMAIGLGAAGTALAVALLGAIPAWRASRVSGSALGVVEPRGHQRPSAVAGFLARAGAAPSSVTGVRMALEPGSGRTAVPVRTTLGALALAVAATSAALVFAASLTHLLQTPRLYGQTWDLALTDYGYAGIAADGRRVLAEDRDVEAFSIGSGGAPLVVDGVRLDAAGYDAVEGNVLPPIVAGRAPAQANEVALGARSLDAVGADLGDVVTVRVVGAPEQARLRIVGKVVLPGLTDTARLGEGALMTFAGISRLAPGIPASDALIDVRPGADRNSLLARLQDGLRRGEATPDELPLTKPSDLVNFGRVQRLPLVLAGVLAVLAVLTLAHLLVTAVRRRRRDLAVLKTLGFEGGQVLAAVAWQAATLVAVALLVGLPLGAAAGRWAWRLFASDFGVVPEPTIPFGRILLVVPAALLAASLVALLPARNAAGTEPARALRTE
jgi:ABC-type lipoprotein release transport system permease subunit